MTQSIPLLLILCTTCFLCQPAKALQINCTITDNQICGQAFCQSADVDLAATLCPRACGYCDKVTNVNCSKGDRQGVCEGNFCSTNDVDLQKALCPNLCGHCNAFDPDCEDSVGRGLDCASVPGICSDVYGNTLCRRTCGKCRADPAASLPPPSTLTPGACEDHVLPPLECSKLNHVCTDSIASAFCPKTCGLCVSATAVSATSTASACPNFATNGLRCQDIPNVCNSAYSKVVCPDFCGQCPGGGSPAATGTAPPPGACVDYVGNGVMCSQLPGLCNDPTSIGPNHFCPRFCKTCGTTSQAPTSMTQATTTTAPTTTTSTPCVDIEIFGKTCSDLNNTLDVCTDTYGQKSCPDFCGKCPCVGPSRNASDDCVDLAETGVCALPGFCEDQFASVVCKQTCFPNLCQNAGCRDHLNQAGTTCADQHGAGQPWPTLDDLCKDPLGAKICQATCGCVGFCPEQP